MPDEPNIESANSERPERVVYRILILDSEENVTKLKNACKDAGHSVVPAHTTEEAIAFLDGTNHADVIVCAAHMEDESMFEFIRLVRDDERHEDTRVLMLALEPGPMATSVSSSTERTGKALGADVYITMPVFDGAELIDQIERLLPAIPNVEQAKMAGENPEEA